VRVRIDHPDAFAADGDLTASACRSLGEYVVGEPPRDACAGGGNSDRFQKVPAILHLGFPIHPWGKPLWLASTREA